MRLGDLKHRCAHPNGGAGGRGAPFRSRRSPTGRADTPGTIGGVIEFTEWATDILSRSDAAARRFNPDARVRVIRDGDAVRFELTDRPGPDDQVVRREGFTLYVEPGLEGIVDVVEPHDQLILRPPGSSERSVREEH
jgi:hypothetical protein